MIRTDGTKVTPARHPSWKAEFISLFVALKMDPWIVLLFPMFFASNYFYTWLFNDYNGALFNIRTRSLNNLVYWTAQIFGFLHRPLCSGFEAVPQADPCVPLLVDCSRSCFCCPYMGIFLPKDLYSLLRASYCHKDRYE